MEPYVFHSECDHPTGVRVTVVGSFNENILDLAVSRCSEKDSFVKKIGREKAIERLNSGNIISSVVVSQPSLNTFINAAKAITEYVIFFGTKTETTLVEKTYFVYPI